MLSIKEHFAIWRNKKIAMENKIATEALNRRLTQADINKVTTRERDLAVRMARITAK